MPELSPEQVTKVLATIPPMMKEIITLLQGYIAGGYIRDVLNGDAPRDLDIFVPYTPSDVVALISTRRTLYGSFIFTSKNPYKLIRVCSGQLVGWMMPIQFIYAPNPVETITNDFDFTMNAVYIGYNDTSWCHQEFLAHCKEKLMVILNDKALRPKGLLHRMFRFVARGYTISNYDLAKIITIVTNSALGKSGVIFNEDVLLQAMCNLWEVSAQKLLSPTLVEIGADEGEIETARVMRRQWRIERAEDYDQNHGEEGQG